MSDPKRAARAFISHNPVGLDPQSQIWTTAIPMTWQNGYEAALDDVAREAQILVAKNDLPIAELWKFVRMLAYGEEVAAEGASDPLEAGWRPTKSGNYRKQISGHWVTIFKNLGFDGSTILWGYGIDAKWHDEVKWPNWQEAADAALEDLNQRIAEAVG